MNNICKYIIEYLVKNRVSTTEVADALGKKGALYGVAPINRGHYRVGQVKWVYAYNESNWSVHKQIQNIEEDRIIFVDAFNCDQRAIFGELVSKYLLLYRQSRAIVVMGNLRDGAALIKENWPIWCKGFNPVGCYNSKPPEDLDRGIIKKNYNKYEDAVAVCDDCGVVIIPKEQITYQLLDALQNIELQEDIWFNRLDRYKESTFEIVCEKKYQHEDCEIQNQ